MELATAGFVRVAASVQGGAAGFRSEVRTAAGWRPASGASRPVEGLTGARVTAAGLAGEAAGCAWSTEFRPEAGGVWVETTLDVSRPVALDPSMALWLGALDHLDDRQAHTWRQTLVAGPTRNQAGLGGNDLPAGYLYDHAQRVATILYYPPDSFAWAPHRFHEFSLRDATQYRPAGRYGFGLFLDTPAEPITFQPGTHHLRWWFTQHEVTGEPPNAWTAQEALIEAVAPLLDPAPSVHAEAPGWATLAEGTLTDLHDEACWIEAGGARGLRAYVRGSSAVGRDRQTGFELMTQLDVLHPLLVWRGATGSERADGLIGDLLRTLPGFSQPAFDYVANGFPPRANATFMDTWYFLENALIKLPWAAALTGDADLRALFAQAMRGADRLIEQTGGLAPLFADATDWRARGALLNAGAAGLYAAGAVLAAQLLDAPGSLAKAWNVLKRLHQLPPAMLTHEPQQLTFGAAAAGYLARHGFGDEARAIAGDLVRLSLRMGYWGADPAAPFYDPRGMFQACASLSYPAFKENVETLLGWPELLADEANHPHLPVELMAAFANLQRCHNYAFFDPWLPEGLRRGPCPHVPYEDLATAEFAHTAVLGKELYGAGEVFWSALMYDVHGRIDAPDVLCLSLDVPCLDLRRANGPGRNFLLYNPASRERSVELRTGAQAVSVPLVGRSWKTLTIQRSHVHSPSA